MKDKISIIIPTYNRAQLIKRAINSVFNQTYSNWELIIVDDGSTDNTKKVIGEFIKDSRVKYFFKKNGGVCSARNYGIDKATGDYIAFLDSDDEFLKNKIFKQLKAIKKNNAEVIICNLIEYRESKLVKNRFNFNKSFFVDIKDVIGYLIPMSASLVFISNKILRENLFDENMQSSNDFDFILRLLINKSNIFFINDKLVINHKSLIRDRISTNFEFKINGYLSILEKINSFEYKLNKSYKNELKFKTYQNLLLFYFMADQCEDGKNICFNLIKEFSAKVASPKILILMFVNFFPFLGKFFLNISKIIWKIGLIQN